MTITFLRSSASTPVKNLKVCQEVTTTCISEVVEQTIDFFQEYLVCINTGEKYCIVCVHKLCECNCSQNLNAPKKQKLTVLKKRDFSCKRDLIVLLDSPHSGETKDYATSKRTFRNSGKKKEKKNLEKKIIENLRNKKGKNLSYKKEVLAKRCDKPHAGFLWFGDPDEHQDYVDPLHDYNDTQIHDDASWAEDSDEHWDYYFFPTITHKFQSFCGEIVRKIHDFNGCFGSSVSTTKRFSTAALFKFVPQHVLEKVFSKDYIRIQRSRHFAELTILKYINFDELLVKPLRIQFFSVYNILRPSLKNVDIWACYLLAVKDSCSLPQFLCITYNSARALGFSLLSPYIEELFASLVNGKFKVQDSSGFNFDDFMFYFKSSFDFYKSIKSSPALTYVIQLFSMLVSHGCCETAGVQFEIAGVKFFREGFLKSLQKTKPSITDIFDLLSSMAEYFVTVGYMCFKHRSFKPLLFDSSVTFEMAQLHVQIMSSWSAVKDLAWEVTPFLDDCDFRDKASKLVAYYKDVYSSLTKVNVHEAVIVKRKWQEIESCLIELTRLMLCGQLRHAPFGILVHGGSSVGKSTFTGIATTMSIIGQGGDPNFELRKVTNPNDEFFSNYSYGTEAIILDDMCNTTIDFTKKSPLEKIVEYINNVPAYPVMADLSSKGKIPLTPKVVVVTTNVFDLNSLSYSNEPVSIMRRFNLHVNICVKKEFAIDSTINQEHFMLDKQKVEAYVQHLHDIGASEEQIKLPDIWDIRLWTVQSASGPRGGAAETRYVPLFPVKDVFCPFFPNLSESSPVSIYQCNEIILQMSVKHRAEQQRVVKQIRSVPAFLSSKYGEEYPHKSFCNDVPHFIDAKEINEKWKRLLESARNWRIPFVSSFLANFGLDPFADIRNLAMFALCPFFPILPFQIYGFQTVWTVASVVSWFSLSYSRWKHFRSLEYKQFKFGTTDGAYLVIACSVKCMFIVYMMRIFWQMVKKQVKCEPQGNLSPRTMEELNDNSAQINCWSLSRIEPIRTSAPDTSVASDLLDACEKNLVLVVCGSKFVNGLFLEQNILLVPHHFLKLVHNNFNDLFQIISRPRYVDGALCNNHTQVFKYSKTAWEHIPGTDLCVYYISNAMPRRSIKQWLTHDYVSREVPAQLIVRDATCKVCKFNARLVPGVQDTGDLGCIFDGYSYNLQDGVTFNGMCTGVWISDTKPTSIVAFHLGGLAGTSRGCAGYASRIQIDNAISAVYKKLHSAVQCGTDGHIDMAFGKNFETSLPQYLEDRVAPKHPVNFLPETSNVVLFGTAGGTHKYHTSVTYRDLGLKFLKRFDIPVQHGPPNMNAPPKWYHFAKNLAEFSTESIGPSLETLEWAVVDYVVPVLTKLTQLGFGENVIVKPLTNIENVNGVPGVRFLDALKVNTAAGFPLRGKTSEYLEGNDGERDFISPAVWLEVARYEGEYLAGRRCYPTFIAHLKDEPVKLGKDKVRVFFGNGTPFKLVVRKYWLPVARLFSELPILCECAIGINSHSLEWDQFLDYVEQFGQDRCIAGDYKGYDQKEFLNVTQTCYSIYLKVAKLIGYSDQDMRIMNSMVPDLTTFTVLYFGALLMMPRGNASGQNMTSYVNSTANSLNSRCAYYDSSPIKPPPPFRKNVHMMTYGDDDIGTVSTKCHWFNARVKAHYLKEYGIEYTPPDKEGDHELYYNTRKVDFLKRQSIYIPEIGHTLGALSEKSVLKSITCGIPSPFLSKEELFGQVLDGGLLEYFAHGKEKYEEFRAKVLLFVAENSLERFVRTSHLTFFDRCEMWRSKYCDDEPSIGYHVDHARDQHRLAWEMSIGHFDSGPNKVNGSENIIP